MNVGLYSFKTFEFSKIEDLKKNNLSNYGT